MSAASTQGPRGGSGEMFDLIADRYDLLNRIISLGMDQSWRRRAVASLGLTSGAKVLDLATGTGDLAFLIAARHGDVEVVGLDPSRGMLSHAEEKARARKVDDRVRFVVGDAEALPYEAATFDGITMAFGIRNVPDRARALREMARVTRPGGRIAILELGEPKAGFFGAFARFHVHTVVPRIGAALSGASEYGYLERSIAAFPPAETFRALMEQSGLEVLEVVPFVFGASNLYVATPRSGS